MVISESFISRIKNEIIEKKKQLYEKNIRDYTGLNIDEFVEDIINEIQFEIRDLVEVDRDVLNSVRRNIVSTKSRWVDSDSNRSDGALNNEVNVVANGLYEKLEKENNRKKFEEIYGAKNPTDLMRIRIVELNHWAKDHSKLTTSYRYLEHKKKYQIVRALTNDIKYIILKELKKEQAIKESKRGEAESILQFPEAIQVPINYTNRPNIKIDDINLLESRNILKSTDKNREENRLVNRYYVDDERMFHSAVNLEILRSLGVNAVLSTLNATDLKTFMYLMSLKDEEFYSTGVIRTKLVDIVESIFKSRSNKNYNAVRESLERLYYMSSGIYDKNTNRLRLGIRILNNLDNVVIDGQEMVTVEVNSNIVDDYVKNRTINMYKDTISNFKQDSVKILIFHLQRHRIATMSDSNKKDLWVPRDMSFFRGALYFTNKRKNANIKTIERALDEIVENKIAVKSYIRKKDIFYINYYPISEKEKEDLMISNKPSINPIN